MEKLFSIVIPTFNSRDLVLETIESALCQDYPHLEVVIDDNTSQDGTPDLIESRFGKDSRLKLFRNQTDLNIPLGWNRAMSHAQGEYLLLLHSDNLLAPQYVSTMVALMEKTEADAGYSECHYFEGVTPAHLFATRAPSSWPFTVLAKGPRSVDYIFRYQRMIPTSALTIRARCLETRAPYHPDFRWDPDIELMTWLGNNFRVLHLNYPLAAIRTHEGQVASWKNPAFSSQYQQLLQMANHVGHSEPHHFLLNWAWSNQDIVQKLSGAQKVSWVTYFQYQAKWFTAETKLVGHFLRYYARKLRLMASFLGRRMTH